jgi:hypothetical protein
VKRIYFQGRRLCHEWHLNPTDYNDSGKGWPGRQVAGVTVLGRLPCYSTLTTVLCIIHPSRSPSQSLRVFDTHIHLTYTTHTVEFVMIIVIYSKFRHDSRNSTRISCHARVMSELNKSGLHSPGRAVVPNVGMGGLHRISHCYF